MRGTPGYRYRPFGKFRLVLAFLVVVQHFVANAAPLGWLYDAVLPYEVGNLAVLVFFCLSGFVISEAVALIYVDRPVAFLANRFLRIVPHFLAGLLIAVALHALFQQLGTLRLSDREHPDLPTSHAFDLVNLLGNILGFLPGINRFLAFDFLDIIWAVRVEMVFYFSVFLALCLPLRSRLGVLTPCLLIALALGTVLVARQFGYGFFFVYGVLLYDHRRHPFSLAACVLGMGLFFFMIPLHTPAHYERAVVAQCLILTGLIGLMTWLSQRRSSRRTVDQACGDLSYPWYVHHQNMLILVISLTAGYSYTAFFLGLVGSLAASYGLMRVVDPSVNRLRTAVRGKRLEGSKSPVTRLA